MCKEEFGVGPCSPFRAVDVVAEDLFLLVGDLGEKGLGGFDNVFDIDAFVLVVE